MADERCAHGLWSCTACAPPGPTLAEMVTELDKFAFTLRGGADVAKALVPMLREVDRRLTALERTDETVWRELYEATNEGRWWDVERLRGELRARGRVADERSAVVPGHDAPCSLFVSLPGREGCARCGFAESDHGR